MAHACRGAISLGGARIDLYHSSTFEIVGSGGRRLHLKAPSSSERQRWLAALRLAKSASQAPDADDTADCAADEFKEARELAGRVAAKLSDLSNFSVSLNHNASLLLRLLAEFHRQRRLPPGDSLLQSLRDKTAMQAALLTAVLDSCRSVGEFFSSESGRWSRQLRRQRRQRQRLQETLAQLVQQRNAMERRLRQVQRRRGSGQSATAGEQSNSDDEFQDAEDTLEDCQQQQQQQQQRRHRRSAIPHRPNFSLNVWSIVKSCVGKELTRIPVPVNFSEPLSLLQRLTEELTYSSLLDRAATADQWRQMALVATFAASAYACTPLRIAKPFNPLLGETFECDRSADRGWRAFAEQVSHHPPAAAFHAEGSAGWRMWQEFSMTSRFRGTYLAVAPQGTAHLLFTASGHHYTWTKVTSTVHNLIFGKMWIDNHGSVDIVNHATADVCRLSFKQYSYFYSEQARRVCGTVSDSAGRPRYTLHGTWDREIEAARVLSPSETAPAELLWRREQQPPNSELMYNFSKLALELNEPEDGVCPTDSRLRPDQRLMELGRWDEANAEKLRLEDKQRERRRRLRSAGPDDATDDANASEGLVYKAGLNDSHHRPAWFELRADEVSGEPAYRFTGEYWRCKEAADWSRCPDLF